jgi:hypothetical protein
MSIAAIRSRLCVLGLSVRSFAAMTGVHYETARHWGGRRIGHRQEFPRWVPLMLEMMGRTVSRKPPNDAVSRPRPDRMTRGTILGNNLSAAVCRTSLASREAWGHMSSNSDINEHYHLVVRRGAVGRKQFVWEIQDNDTARVIQSSMEPFATMEEAHRSGLSALACLTD